MNLTTINKGWKFYLGEQTNADEKGFDDRAWQEVTLPHDWSVTLPFDPSHSSGTAYLPGGIGWYRLHLNIPKECKGKKLWVQFDGVYKNSQVWVNGYYLGKRPYGYTTFRYDITPYVTCGEGETVISVKVRREELADSRWYPGTGITRSVHLITADTVYVEPDECFFLTKEQDADGTWHMEVELTLRNEETEQQKRTMVVTLEDQEGKKVAKHEEIKVIASKGSERCIVALSANELIPWSIDTPSQYRLVVRLFEGEQMREERMELVGVRTAVFDVDQGFFLNGQSMKLKGVCLHHDAGCLGAAVPKEVWRRRLVKLKEIGCNAIRMSHNPHAPELYELCDELGFVVFDEAFDEWEGPKNKWWQGHNVYPPKRFGYFEDFIEWHERDLVAMIKRDRNHPSVIAYSIGNEIDYPNDPYAHPMFSEMTGNNDANKPKEERMYDPNRPNSERLAVIAAYLSDIVKKTDSTRPVTVAAAFPELSSHIGLFDAIDLIGYNYKEHLYEDDHKRFPTQPLIGSENSHEVSAWLAVTDHEYIAGQFLWTGIDYLGEASGWPVHGSPAGLLTTAGFEKVNYYYRKSLWCNDPMVYIATAKIGTMHGMWGASRCYNYEEGELIDVFVYTNQEEVELFQNGHSLGRKKKEREAFAIHWQIEYEPGLLRAVSSNGAASDHCETAKHPSQYDMRVWKSKEEAKNSQYEGVEAIVADGESILQIEVTALDASGNPVTWEERTLHIEVSGEGTLLGIDNGDLADPTPYSSPIRKTHQGQLIVYVRTTEMAGDIRVRVTDEFQKRRDLYITSVHSS